MKKIFYLFIILIILMLLPKNIYASDSIAARIGNTFFDNLEEAILAAGSNDIIILTSDITLDKSLPINKTVNINLNNHRIVADEKVFFVYGGSLNLSGTGTIEEKKPNYGAIYLLGSEDPSKKNFSTVSVGKNIILQGWSGIFIAQNDNKSYGILVNMNGRINAIDDINGDSGVGIYVNGNIYNESNSPIINLSNEANINSTGTGIYAAGYASYNIDGAYISGNDSGLAIKSGIFNIINATIIGTGQDKTPTSGNNNGINPSGAAIQIESNPGYKGNIELTIKNGIIKSKYSNVVYEYTVNGSTQVKTISISGGTFISEANKNVFSFSNSFDNTHNSFISGGIYSTNPTKYLKSGYTIVNNSSSLYEVISTTMSVATYNISDKQIPLFLIIFLVIFFLFIIVCYLKRKGILVFIKY